MPAALVALAASLAYGTSDFLAGLQSRKRTVWSVVVISQPTALLVAALFLAPDWSWPAGLGGILPPLPFIKAIRKAESRPRRTG